MTFAAVTNETIGWTIFIVILVGVVVYVSINILRSGKAELGSEIELAPNRKPYLPDEQLEGPKLDRTLTIALHHVVRDRRRSTAVLDPRARAGRRERRRDFRETFEKRGAAMFAPVGTSLDALGCEGCHGPKGVGGITSYNLIQPDGDREGRQLASSRARHGAAALLSRRGHVHHHVRASVLSHAGVGCRRRRCAQRPAGPEPRRLHPVHPDLAGRSPATGQGRAGEDDGREEP